MFTGIIEEVGIVKKIKKDKKNLIIDIGASFTNDLQIKQSVAHNGVCLTITDIEKNYYTVCVINETISKTNLQMIQPKSCLNLERCLIIGQRLDGHFVQGHVDCTIRCIKITKHHGSWLFQFKYPKEKAYYLVPQGSITLNGVSLTISNINDSELFFDVNIIPYTFQHTTFQYMQVGDYVNVEFDLISKQVVRLQKIIQKKH